jgi:O-antigen/teichoic acid export membrane protein
MLDKIRRLGTETAIYGLSTILGRFLNFFLVPFYTHVLLPGEYGVVAYLYSIIAFVTVVYSYGMESAYFKYSSTLEIGTERDTFSTPFIALFGSSIVFSCLIAACTGPIAGLFSLPGNFTPAVYYAAGILALDAIAIIPFASLRMQHRAGTFAAIKFLNIVINVGMNILLLLVFRMGGMGVFVSGLIASAATLLMLLPVVYRQLSFRFHRPLFTALLGFGLPYIPSGLSAMTMQVIDRPILRAMTDDATVGIYQANYRLGIFMMLVVSMYDYAWRPFFFATAGEPDAKQIFARVLTYLVLFMSAVGLVLTMFIGDLARLTVMGRHLIGPAYWGGLPIVPIVLFGYAFLGVATNLAAGIYIEKKTRYLPLVTFAGAAVNVIANIVLIPFYGMTGAAWATLLAYLAQAVATWLVVRRMYPVNYETARLAKIAGSVVIVLALYYLVPPGWIVRVPPVVWNVALLALFGGLIVAMKLFNPRELAVLGRLGRRR